MTGNELPIGDDDLQAFVDGRLDDARRRAVEAHLAARPELADRVAAERRDRTLLRGQLDAKFAEPVPARLRISTLRAARRERWTRSVRSIAAALAIFVVGGVAGWFASSLTPSPRAAAPTMNAMVSSSAESGGACSGASESSSSNHLCVSWPDTTSSAIFCARICTPSISMLDSCCSAISSTRLSMHATSE